MSFTESIASVFSKFNTTDGRASRSEYWWFYLFALIMNWAATFVDAATSMSNGLDFPLPVLQMLVGLALMIPQIAVSVRRLHDTGRSGWYVLLPLTCVGVIPFLMFLAQASDEGENAYGPRPAK